MRFTFLFVLFITACLEDPLHKDLCGNDCAINLDGDLLLDEEASAYAEEIKNCGVGQLHCEDGIQTCQGWRTEFTEQCNTELVELCDGYPLNTVFGRYSSLNDCNEGQVGVCDSQIKMCTNIGWQCIKPSTYGEERCDGLDNNCDNRTDESDGMVYINPPFRYNAPLETANVGTCRPGVIQCIAATEVYVGEVDPAREQCANNIDEDCDGLTDESNQDPTAAFYLSLDFSGSMDEEIEAVITAICEWSLDPQFDQSVFGVDAVSVVGYSPSFRHQITDFTTAEQACEKLTEFYNSGPITNGDEFMPFSMVQSMSSEYHWPEGLDRKIIMFSDEVPHYNTSHLTRDDDALIEVCEENLDLEVGFFVTNDNAPSWQHMVVGCDGWVEILGVSVSSMLEALNRQFRGTC